MKTQLIEKLREAFQLGQQWVHDINNGDDPENFNSWLEKQNIQALEKQESEQGSVEGWCNKCFDIDYPENTDELNVGSLYDIYKKAFKSGYSKAMQTYASRQSDALEFIEWVDNNKYRRNQIMKFWWQDQKPKITYTNEELYNQYLKEKEGKI